MTDDANPYLQELIRSMSVSPGRFYELVVSNAPELLRRGYMPEPLEDVFLVWLWKKLDEGVRCAVRFELLPYSNPQVFKVTVLRRRQRATVDREKPYAPVILDLRNIASLLFGKELFTPDRYYWEFSDEVTLLQQIAEAQSAILEYGLAWIEDPKSSVGKVRTLMRKRMQSREKSDTSS